MRRARKAGARRTGAFGACAAGRLEKALCKFTFYVLFSHLFTNSIDNFAKFVYNTNTIQYAASKATKGLQIKVKNALRTLLVLLLLLSLFLVSVSALPAVVSGSETAGTVDAVINAASTESAIRFSADRAVRLKSFSTGGYAYTMYTLLPYGYAILCDETGALMEACYEESALPPYPIAHLKDFYYGGPLNYFILENGVFHELYTQQSLTAADLSSFAALDEQVRSSLSDARFASEAAQPLSALSNASTSYTIQPNYFKSLTKIPENKNGTCTIIAAVLLFSYYDTYVNDSFIATANELSNNSEALHTILCYEVYGSKDHGGIFIRDALSGFNDYLSTTSCGKRMTSIYSPEDTARGKILSELAAGRPVIASMGVHLGSEWDHSVVVYGITFTSASDLSTATINAHMGWKDNPNNNRVLSLGWFYECGYMICANHSYGSWHSTGSYSHSRTCTVCGETEYQPHAETWNAIRQKCNRCGYSGPLTEPFRYGEAECCA